MQTASWKLQADNKGQPKLRFGLASWFRCVTNVGGPFRFNLCPVAQQQPNSSQGPLSLTVDDGRVQSA